MNKSGNTTLARLVCDERTAKRVADALSEGFEDGGTAVAAFEGTGGRWTVEVHFETPPDEAAVRAVVERSAGTDGCRTRLRDDRRKGLGRGEPRRAEAGHGRALHGARRA